MRNSAGTPTTALGCLFNWNLLGDGEHTVVAYVDGLELARATVMVTPLDGEFVRDVAGACVVADFPAPDESVRLVWQEAKQNFVLATGPGPGRREPGRGSRREPSGESGAQLVSEWDWAALGLGV